MNAERREKTEKTIYLIRHAESIQIDKKKAYLGQRNPDLNAAGINQSEMLCRAFKDYPLRAIYTSDLLRAVHTALLLIKNHHCQPERIREFREISLGEWEGRTFQEIQSRYPEEYEQRGQDIANYRPPGGESFSDLQRRVFPVFTKVVEKTKGDLIIVGHSGVNRVILCKLIQLPIQELFSIPQDYAGVNIIRENRGNYRVVSLNVNLNAAINFLKEPPHSSLSPPGRGKNEGKNHRG